MKFFLLSLITLCCFTISVQADEFLNIPYKNIKENGKIKLIEDSWSDKITKHDENYFIKTTSDGTGSYSEYFNPDGSYAFTTGCQYEFVNHGNLIGYSNPELKFYDFTFFNGGLNHRELTVEEVQSLFPDFTIVKISDFSPYTNSLKIKRSKGGLKLIVLNDTDRNFYHYTFTSDNAKFEKYPLTGFLNIKKKGMIQFSHFGENTKESPWFILLIR